MKCTSCQSDNVQKISIVYESGTQSIKTSSTGVHSGTAFGIGQGGMGAGFGSGTTRTTTKGKSQSLLASKFEPPKSKRYTFAVILIGLGLVLFLFELIAMGVVMIAIGGFVGYKANTYNKGVWPVLFDKWSKKWYCNKCGNVYVEG